MFYKIKHFRLRNKNFLRIIIFLIIILSFVCLLSKCFDTSESGNTTDLNIIETESTTPVVHTATIGAVGDLLMHKPIFGSYDAEIYQDGNYNFDSIFKYIQDDISNLDFAVANLETTLCGVDNGYEYSGYPNFNCPDSLVNSVKNSGFDMLLTANNHSYDTSLVGYKRTLNVVSEAGLETLGTYSQSEETKWTILDINGINVGMLCYTWASYDTDDGRPSLNGNAPISEHGLCNYFCLDNLPAFYSEVETYLTEMNKVGVDITMMFIHWGEEYQLSANNDQKQIAQKLCDMGIDVIIGGHPHVVQPIELLESTVNSEHKTICLYSTGNAVSNQRLGNISYVKTAHTEDGILFSVTFEKLSGNRAYVSDINIIPLWVNMHANNTNEKREYNILPLNKDTIDTWKDDFNLSNFTYEKAKDSYDRTMDIVGEGLADVQAYLDTKTYLQ